MVASYNYFGAQNVYFSSSYKISFRAIVLLWTRSAHSIRVNFTNNISGQETVRFIDTPFDSGCGDSEGPDFILCMDGREPQVHVVWDFGEDSVTREVRPTVHVDVGAGFVGEFSTN